MTIDLDSDEVADIIIALESQQSEDKQRLTELTELEDRYEHNDTCLRIIRVEKTINKLRRVKWTQS